jgi:hypothetical protein
MMEFNLVAEEDEQARIPKKGLFRKKSVKDPEAEKRKEKYRTPLCIQQLLIASDEWIKYHRKLLLDEARLRGSR